MMISKCLNHVIFSNNHVILPGTSSFIHVYLWGAHEDEDSGEPLGNKPKVENQTMFKI